MDDKIHQDSEFSIIQAYRDSIIKFGEFDEVLRFLRYKYALCQAQITLRLRKHVQSVVIAKSGDFTEQEIGLVIDIKDRSVYKRRILSDSSYILFKEMLSPGHATASQLLENMVTDAVVTQLLAPSDKKIVCHIRPFGDGSVF